MSLELIAIDGANPLGFVAAMGVVAVVEGKLAWENRGARWVPVLSELDRELRTPDALVDRLWQRLEAVPFAYTLVESGDAPYDDFKEKKGNVASSARSSPSVRSVTETVFRQAIERCWNQPDELQRLAAHTCAVALRGERIGVTAVRSVSGQLRYLKNLRAIVERCKRDDLKRALFERWQYRSGFPKLGLDPNGAVSNVPVDVGALGAIAEIGGERLAIEGLRGMPTSMRGGRLVTRGYDRRGSRFRWALSTVPRSFRSTSSILEAVNLVNAGNAGVGDGNGAESLRVWIRAMGVGAVYDASVRMYSQGYKLLDAPLLIA